MEGHPKSVMTTDHGFQSMPHPINEIMTSSGASGPFQAATNFSDLPFEIRTDIYSLAIPLSRVLRMRLNKGHKPGGYAESISHPCVPTILHINRESRAVGLKIFRLSFGAFSAQAADGSALRERDIFRSYWNPAIDTLYLPFLNPLKGDPIQITKDHVNLNPGYNTDAGEDTDACLVGSDIYHKHRILSHVRHLALPNNRKTRVGFGPSHALGEMYTGGFPEGNLRSWIRKFENLESLTLLQDPFPGWYRSGEILLYEPDEEGEDQYCKRAVQLLRETESEVEKALEAFAKGKDWEPPSVEVLIMGNRKTRKPPAFCIRPKREAVKGVLES